MPLDLMILSRNNFELNCGDLLFLLPLDRENIGHREPLEPHKPKDTGNQM